MAGCAAGAGGVSSDTTTSSVDAMVGSVAMSPMAAGGSACEWVTAETVERTLGVAVAAVPGELAEDQWGCAWRGNDAELSIQFDRFHTGRSVAAELIQLRDTAEDGLVVVQGLQGAFPRPGVWRGETALQQYGMMTIQLTRLDLTEPDLIEFKPVVTAVIDDVLEAAPSVPE